MELNYVIKYVTEELSIGNVFNHINMIARYHRIQGSPGLIEASKYVYRILKEYDLHVEWKSFIYDGKTRYYTLTTPMPWTINDAYLKLIKPKEEMLLKFSDHPTMVVAHSPPTPPEGVTGKLIYIGDGSKLKSWVNVKGKIVLTYGNRYKIYKYACKHGAQAVLYFKANSPCPEGTPYIGLFLTRKELDRYGRVPFASIPEALARRLISLLEKGEDVVVQLYINSSYHESMELPVVYAEIKGKNKIGYGAISHICHPKPGVNDNASGSALLLEIARVLSKIVKMREKTNFTLRFIWVPEYYGTLALISNDERVSKYTIAMLNLDMVGEDQSKCGSSLLITYTPLSRPSFINAIVELAANTILHGGKSFSNLIRLPLLKYTISSYDYGSDHDVLNDFNIPSVMFVNWPDKYYHTDMDSVDKVSRETLKLIGLTAASTLAYLAYINEKDYISLVNHVKNWCLKYYYSKLIEMSSTISKNSASLLLNVLDKTLESIMKINPSDTALSRFVSDARKELRGAIVINNSKSKGDNTKYIRMYKGPFSIREYVDVLGEDKIDEIIDFLDKNKYLHTIIHEMLMLLDIPRSIDEVYEILNVEYPGKVDKEKVKKLFDILEAAGIVKKI